MKRIIISMIFAVMVISVFVGIALVYRAIYQPTDNYRAQDFIIHEGENFSSVASRLMEQKIISSAFILRLYARINKMDSSIQKGAYIIPGGLAAREVITYLSSGRQNLVKITIPEGKTIRQVADIFEKIGLTSAEEFKQAAFNASLASRLGIPAETLEGYLFPDTYYFATDFPAEKIIEHMVTLFFEKLEDIYPDYEYMSKQEIHEKIVMASIVEREYRAAEEAPLIASVFYNRLEQGIRLESCATVVYVMTEIEGLDHPGRLFFADLERPSPFNTYYNSGLPPSPISGVGLTALSAAFYPATTEYLYFVLESPSAPLHVFSENYRQHLLASESYYVKLN